MSPEIKNDLMHLLNILESIEKTGIYLENSTDAEAFYNLRNQMNFNAALTQLSNFGEIVIKLSEALKAKYSEIDWKNIRGFRNRIVHDYHGLDIYIVFDILTDDLPALRDAVIKIVHGELKAKAFDREEFKAAMQSDFYGHVPFQKLTDKPKE